MNEDKKIYYINADGGGYQHIIKCIYATWAIYKDFISLHPHYNHPHYNIECRIKKSTDKTEDKKYFNLIKSYLRIKLGQPLWISS